MGGRKSEAAKRAKAEEAGAERKMEIMLDYLASVCQRYENAGGRISSAESLIRGVPPPGTEKAREDAKRRLKAFLAAMFVPERKGVNKSRAFPRLLTRREALKRHPLARLDENGIPAYVPVVLWILREYTTRCKFRRGGRNWLAARLSICRATLDQAMRPVDGCFKKMLSARCLDDLLICRNEVAAGVFQLAGSAKVALSSGALVEGAEAVRVSKTAQILREVPNGTLRMAEEFDRRMADIERSFASEVPGSGGSGDSKVDHPS